MNCRLINMKNNEDRTVVWVQAQSVGLYLITKTTIGPMPISIYFNNYAFVVSFATCEGWNWAGWELMRIVVRMILGAKLPIRRIHRPYSDIARISQYINTGWVVTAENGLSNVTSRRILTSVTLSFLQYCTFVHHQRWQKEIIHIWNNCTWEIL